MHAQGRLALQVDQYKSLIPKFAHVYLYVHVYVYVIVCVCARVCMYVPTSKIMFSSNLQLIKLS